MMQSSLCFALLATAAALQAPMTRTQQRRVVAQRAPMDVLAPTSSALCAGADDDYTAPKIEFDPDADGARAASDIALPFGHGGTDALRESAPCRSVVRFVDDARSSRSFFFQRSRRPRPVERLEERHIYWIGGHRSAAAAVLLRRPAMSGLCGSCPRPACGGLAGDLWLVRRLVRFLSLVRPPGFLMDSRGSNCRFFWARCFVVCQSPP